MWDGSQGRFTLHDLILSTYKRFCNICFYEFIITPPIIFQRRGINVDGVTGIDISSGMLEKAKDRRCYNKLIKADITKPLTFAQNSLDYLICVGTSTYLGNSNNKNSILESCF